MVLPNPRRGPSHPIRVILGNSDLQFSHRRSALNIPSSRFNVLRQADGEHCPLPSLARHRHIASVGLHYGFYQAQPQAQSALRTAFITAIQSDPDFVLFLWRDADAVVPENSDGLAVFASHRDIHAAVFGSVLDRVIQEIREDLAYSGAVGGRGDGGWPIIGYWRLAIGD